MRDNKVLTWLKRIFTLKTLEVILAIGAIVIAYYQFVYQRGGELTIVYGSENVENNGTQYLVICTDTPDSDFNGLPLSPEFINASEHSVREFQLQYRIKAEGLELHPTINYRIVPDNGYIALRYLDNIIYSYSAADVPIGSVTLTSDSATCDVYARATYDGAKRPFEYTVSTSFVIIPRPADEKTDHWIARCKQKIASAVKASTFNIFYISGNERQFVSCVNIASLNSEPQGDPIENKTSEPATAPAPGEKAISQAPVAVPDDSTIIKEVVTITNEQGDEGVELYFNPIDKPADLVLAIETTDRKSNAKSYSSKYIGINPEVASYRFLTEGKNTRFAGICQEDPELQRHIRHIGDGIYKNFSNTPVVMTARFNDESFFIYIKPWGTNYFYGKPAAEGISDLHFYHFPDSRSWGDKVTDSAGFVWTVVVFFILLGIAVCICAIAFEEKLSGKIKWFCFGLVMILIPALIAYNRFW